MAEVARLPAREAELSHAQLRALVDRAPDAILVADLEGRYNYVNDAGCRLLGCSREEVIGAFITDLLAAEDVGRLLASKEQMLHGGSHVAQWNLRRKDGTWVPVEVHASILPDGQWQALVRDLSEHKRNEQRLELALEGARAAIWDTDLRSGEVLLGSRWSEMLGGPRVPTRTTLPELMAMIHPEDLDAARRVSRDTLKGLSPHYVSEHRVRARDGRWIWVLSRGKVVERDRVSGRALRMIGTNTDISERKAQEAEREALLRHSESDRRWLRTVLETMPLAMILVQPDGRVHFNRRTEELLGMKLSSSESNAQYAGRIRYPDGRPVPPEDLPSSKALREGAIAIAAEYGVEREDGSRVTVLVSAAPIREAGGNVIGAAAFFQDVSEFMRMEQAIRTNERLLRAIFELLPVGVWIADASGRLVKNNPAGERIWKGARYVDVPRYGEYRGWWVETGKPIAAEEWGMARALRKGETSAAELVRIQCFDGSFKTILHAAAPLRDEKGEIAGAIVVNEDITALHAAQEKYRVSEQLLRTVFDLLPVGVWIADGKGRITLANAAAERLWQGTRSIGLGKLGEYKGWWVETGKPIAADEWAIARAVRKGETSRGELLRIQCFDGSLKTVINFAAPIRSDAGEIVGAVAVNEDVTSLQHTQEQLRAAVRDREEILAIVTHDLRNPLAGLMMGASAAERKARDLAGGETVRALAASLVDISRRMSGLVDDLLAVAVEGTGGRSMLKPAAVPASSLIARAADAARPVLARDSHELQINVTGELPTVHADADRILRVFANLLDNALKFTSAPGRITLTAERTTGGVRFSVANSGPPLPERQLRAMFKPFWQAGRDRRGAGLGLSICRSIVEAHGGSIWAEPAEGERVRVCFVLPRQPVATL